MFSKQSPRDPGLQATIDDVRKQMSALNADDPEYAKMVDQLAKLYTIEDKNSPKSVSPDTLVTVAANIIGILIITQHERAHVIGGKAIGFVRQLK